MELVLAEEAARVLAVRPRLGAEARRERGVRERERRLVEDLAGVQVGERHLRRRDQVARLAVERRRQLEEILFELWELARPLEGVLAHEVRHHRLGVPVLRRVRVEEEVDQRALEPRQRAAQHREAGARQLRREALFTSVQFLNNKMAEQRDNGNVIGAERIAVMAALNIAHEYLEFRRSNESMASDIGEGIARMQSKIAEALTQDAAFELTTSAKH